MMPALAVPSPSQLWDFAVTPGTGLDGVVEITASGAAGTGALLPTGRHVLTAAHVVEEGGVIASKIQVYVDGPWGTVTIPATKVTLHPAYDYANENHDLAIIELAFPAPTRAERYPIYREDDEVGRVFTFVGYGDAGTGALGTAASGPAKLWARNRFDADMAAFTKLGILAWNPEPGIHLAADFDNGTPARDALGQLLGITHLGLGTAEGIITPGDSGGPAFLDGHIAGVASYGASLSWGSLHPDIDSLVNGTFGEIGAWQRVSAHQEWIDRTLRAALPGAPTTPQQVVKQVPEGNSGTTLAYFLVEFTGTRETPQSWVSVDFATRDGSALAGEDYIATAGRLVLYPDETSAVIPVEIIGDTIPEGPEVFYLDIFNPVGGSFGAGVQLLTASRTILDDDGWV